MWGRSQGGITEESDLHQRCSDLHRRAFREPALIGHLAAQTDEDLWWPEEAVCPQRVSWLSKSPGTAGLCGAELCCAPGEDFQSLDAGNVSCQCFRLYCLLLGKNSFMPVVHQMKWMILYSIKRKLRLYWFCVYIRCVGCPCTSHLMWCLNFITV